MSLESLYEVARYNGLGHDAALDAIADGEFVCWCGRREHICYGGAQRLIGCPTRVDTPYGSWDFSRHKSDLLPPATYRSDG